MRVHGARILRARGCAAAAMRPAQLAPLVVLAPVDDDFLALFQAALLPDALGVHTLLDGAVITVADGGETLRVEGHHRRSQPGDPVGPSGIVAVPRVAKVQEGQPGEAHEDPVAPAPAVATPRRAQHVVRVPHPPGPRGAAGGVHLDPVTTPSQGGYLIPGNRGQFFRGRELVEGEAMTSWLPRGRQAEAAHAVAQRGLAVVRAAFVRHAAHGRQAAALHKAV
mmetsp:Transcript_38683/g.119296  ORF Transcript_38683/g.119296 Transcript_38683/m.119296 type:complete len:223 (-) Transcript_38683:442-1110(-)